MPAIAQPPPPIAGCYRHDLPWFATQENSAGREGQLVSSNLEAVREAWYGHSAFHTRRMEGPADEPPAVPRTPIIRTVRTRFFNAGQHLPPPFGESDVGLPSAIPSFK